MAKGYPGGVDLSGGQWQRVALARAIAKVGTGADVVLLDEPTAMLDVRGESEIFRRVLGATSEATTILVSHRFSTVRQAELICVVEHGRAIELGSHDELMALARALPHDVRPPGQPVQSRSSTSTGRRSCMSRFDDGTAEATGEDTAGPMPPALPSMVRVVKLGYRAEPRLLLASLAMTLLQALPDVLVALWLALITDGLVHHHAHAAATSAPSGWPCPRR